MYTQMIKYASEDPEYSNAIRQWIIENEIQTFMDARRIISRVRSSYVQLYDFVFKNWDSFSHSSDGQTTFSMHG